MAEAKHIDIETLRSLLAYDPETGVFTWSERTSNRIKVGDVAGSKGSNGYVYIKTIFGKFLAHRLAWLHAYGVRPAHDIDHINGIRDDNRIANLREVTRKQNLENQGLQPKNSSGYRGVHWSNRDERFVAQVHHNSKNIYAGKFDSAEEAASAAAAKRAELFTHDTGRDRRLHA